MFHYSCEKEVEKIKKYKEEKKAAVTPQDLYKNPII